MPQFGVVVLAAGSSSRMGSPKQLLDYGGKPLLRHAVETALASMCRNVMVVLGARAPELRPALEGLAVTILENPRWEEGMGTSIQTGVARAQAEGLDGVILALADQPLVTPEILDRLARTHLDSGQPIVAAQYAGTVGVPVFFSREFFPNLLALKPGQGCKGVILSHSGQAIHLDCPEAEMDVDTPQDYDRVQRTASS
ncbi:MAG TPA: nucleotidyltransferase family protein [Bryobacteraceae bacterium]|nr:nucleotidyltransferase family protein [Bryobacteraceae bacterium]